MEQLKKSKWGHVDVNGVNILLGDDVRPTDSMKYVDDYTVTEIGKTKVTLRNPQTGKLLRLVPNKIEVM
jgi:hypothetical protein